MNRREWAAAQKPKQTQNDTYWQVKHLDSTKANLRSSLEKNGYKLKASLRQSELAVFLFRHKAGYLNYDKCTDAELQKFLTDRRIILKKTSGNVRCRNINKLREADASPTFRKFKDLPPELHLRIYQIAMEDFAETMLFLPKEPPICHVSRLVRKESLPVFYGTCTFGFTVDVFTVPFFGVCFEPESKKYSRGTAGSKMGMMRKIVLDIGGAGVNDLRDIILGYGPPRPLRVRATIEMSPDGKTHAVQCFTSHNAADWNEKVGEISITSFLSSFMDGVV